MYTFCLLMLPFIVLFGYPVPTYGLLILLGIIFSLLLGLKNCSHYRIDRLDLLIVVSIVLPIAFIGAVVLYQIVEWKTLIYYIQHYPFKVVYEYLTHSGLVFLGGLAFGCLGMWIAYKITRVSLSHLVNLWVISIPLGHAFGRLGCLFAGCCYGIPSAMGITFRQSFIAPVGIKLFPTQLVEAVFNICLCVVLYKLSRSDQYKMKVAWIYAVAYSLFRFNIEWLRGDPRGFFLGLSTSQWFSLIVFIGACIVGIIYKRHARKIR